MIDTACTLCVQPAFIKDIFIYHKPIKPRKIIARHKEHHEGHLHNKNTTGNPLVLTSLNALSEAGCNKKIDVEVCVTADRYPEETALVAEDEGGDVCQETGN